MNKTELLIIKLPGRGDGEDFSRTDASPPPDCGSSEQFLVIDNLTPTIKA